MIPSGWRDPIFHCHKASFYDKSERKGSQVKVGGLARRGGDGEGMGRGRKRVWIGMVVYLDRTQHHRTMGNRAVCITEEEGKRNEYKLTTKNT